ncbi:transmembrane sensory transduction histidine kinase for metal resistance [Thermomicrobium sp. 4228-Ro]|uniref:transmembrane sensory transduction histidine kinase for metal resistance n=1 Tax=Thermomicrobium sp. 4228-Ro TaxID=2993937 RepID=UPI0022487CE9|nr:transmembrane sensory transduction histidine kinase for metal resistance [Thermomicrobium sp. 4228-Ro]MCX2727956.1 transmembrane sensory transduction histidine kinase for metal resistance [Thermomicrobium sp. 4228-Ro]
MDFGLPEMQLIALIGLLGIASLAAWNSAILWRRQRALEEALADLAERVAAWEHAEPPIASDRESDEPAPQIAQLVEMLKAADRSALDALLHPPFDLPRTPAFEVDDVPATGPHFGFRQRNERATREA